MGALLVNVVGSFLLVPWKPLGEVSRLCREMENLWDRFLGERPFPRLLSEEWLPSVDISETGDNLLIRAELPGMDAKDVEVTLSGNMLTIKGEKKKEEEEKGESYYSSERYYGAYERALRLPVEVQTDKAEATFDKGVLTITLPKVEAAKKREIEIKVK